MAAARRATGGAAQSQYSLVLLDLWLDISDVAAPARPVAVSAPRFAAPIDPLTAIPFSPSGFFLAGTQYLTSARILEDLGGRTGLVKLVTDFAATSLWAPAELGDALHLSGGIPTVYDGARVNELGFTYYPENGVFTIAGSSFDGGGLTLGAYQYVLVFVHADARAAKISRSIASAPISVVTSNATNTVTALIS